MNNMSTPRIYLVKDDFKFCFDVYIQCIVYVSCYSSTSDACTFIISVFITMGMNAAILCCVIDGKS